MTLLIIGLVAALGIGGGIALSGGGGGGGGSHSTPAYEEVYNNPSSQPDILSILATAERYKHTQTVMTQNRWEDYITLAAGNEKIQITSDSPIVENGKFAYSVVDGELEDTWGPYSVEITKDNYQKSDKYADYYAKEGTTKTGLYNMKDLASEQDNWVQENITLTEKLALGGRILGLKNSDFGYHQQDSNSTNFGSGVSQVNSFYMYDDTKLASASRSDTATFSGNLLGGIEAIDNDGVGEFLPYNLTGTATATIDFATNNLLAQLNTKLNDKTYHTFNATGTIDSPSSFSISNLTIDSSKGIDSSLNVYRLSSIYGSGNGKILSDSTQTELVGQLDFWGNAVNSQYDELIGNLAFGMIEGREVSSEGDGENDNEESVINSISRLATSSHYLTSQTERFLNNYRIMSDIMNDIEQFQNINIGNEVLSFTNPKLNVWSNGYSYAHQSYTVNMTTDDYQNSDLYADYYAKIDSLLSGSNDLRDMLALGGKIIGLRNSDFGYQRQELRCSSTRWCSSALSSVFYMYDMEKLSTIARLDTAVFSGNILGTVGYKYEITEGHQAMSRGDASLAGTVVATVNFMTHTLSAYLDTKFQDAFNDTDYYAFQATGQITSPSGFSISNVVLDNNKNIDENLLVNGYSLSSVSGSGSGVFLSDNAQNEMVGNIEFVGSTTVMNGGPQEATLFGNLSFGAKEVQQ